MIFARHNPQHVVHVTPPAKPISKPKKSVLNQMVIFPHEYGAMEIQKMSIHLLLQYDRKKVYL